jgi:predicted Ser/Thr protein kinase
MKFEELIGTQFENVDFLEFNKTGATSILYIDEKKTCVLKRPTRFKEYDILEREVHVYKLLNSLDIKWCPKLLYHNNSLMIIDFVGEEISINNIPFDYHNKINKILDDMKKLGIKHNDICKNNNTQSEILVKEGELYLVDYGWATIKDDYTWGNSKMMNKEKPYGIIDNENILGYLDEIYEKKKEGEKLFYFIINHNRLDVLRQQIIS